MRTVTTTLLVCAVAFCLGSAPAAYAQLTINDAATGGETAASLAGILIPPSSNATIIGTPTLTGDARCAGRFTGGLFDGLGLDAGVVLASGQVIDAVGPNDSDSTTTLFGTSGDAALTSLANSTTFDACILEFDFQCPGGADEVVFNYQFTSEEYNEFVNSPYNNVFAFFLNATNIALVPTTAVPVAINNVNCGNPYNSASPTFPTPPFCDLFINNDLNDGGPFFNVEPDGLIVPLAAVGNLAAGTNNIRLGIADAGDSILDSWVFIQGGSFECFTRVKIDLKPGSNPNCTNLDSHGVVTVVVFGREDFDVTTIDVSTLTFAGAPVVRSTLNDIPMEGPPGVFPAVGDGIRDLVLKFQTKQLVVPTLGPDGCAPVNLNGALIDGTTIIGTDILCLPGQEACDLGALQPIPSF